MALGKRASATADKNMNETDRNMRKELPELLGPDGYLLLLENHGGIRLFVPKTVERSKLKEVLGFENLRRLSDCYGGEYLKIPLDREFRANRYSTDGKSNAAIARLLGISESGVERLFQRIGRADPRQIDMFDNTPA